MEKAIGSYWTQTFGIGSPQETACLEDIIGLLHEAFLRRGEAQSPQSIEARIAKCLERCKPEHLAYTERAFLQYQLFRPGDQTKVASLPSDDEMMERLRRRVAEFANRPDVYTMPGKSIGFDMVQCLLRQREYGVLQWMFRRKGSSMIPILVGEEIPQVARLLAEHGFAQLLETLLDSAYYGPKIFDTCSHAHYQPRYGCSGLTGARTRLPGGRWKHCEERISGMGEAS